MSECRSFSSNHRLCSQSRKISIGVLVNSVSKEGNKDIKDTVMPIAEIISPSKENCVKDHGGHNSLLERSVAVTKKDASPWFSTKSFNPKASSSVAVHVTDQSPSSLATRRVQSRLKVFEKASAANSSGKIGLEADEYGHKLFGKTNHFMDARTLNDKKHAKTTVFSKEPGVVLGNEPVQDKDKKKETEGNETLKMKLWKILGNISPDKDCPNPQSVKLHPDEDGHQKHSPVEERNLNSDKIESDSEKHTSGRPMTRSLNRKKTFTRNQQSKIEATKPTCHRKVFPQKRLLSLEDCSGRLYDKSNKGSLTSKRNKIGKQSSGSKMHYGEKNEIAEEKQQSERNGNPVPVEKLMMQRSIFVNVTGAYDRKCDVFEELNVGRKKGRSTESPHTEMIEQQKDVEQLVDAEISSLKDQQVNSLSKNRRTCVQDPVTCVPDPVTPNLQTHSPECLPTSKPEKLHGCSPAEKIFIMQGIQSFKSFLSSKSDKGKANVQLEVSDGRCEVTESLHIEPRRITEDNCANQMPKSSNNQIDTENLEDDSAIEVMKNDSATFNSSDSSEPEQLSPNVCVGQKFLHGTNKVLGKEKDEEMTECIPESKSFKGTQDDSELQTYLEQNQEDGLARAVALFNVALCQIKMKLKSMSNKRSAEILWAAAEETFLLLKNAESQIKTDEGKLTTFNQSKRKQLENRFKEQQEQLLGIYKRFKDEIDRHLKDYNDIIEDAEEHATELKRTMERQRAAHKMLITQVEQEIKVQLEDAESRIMAVQELAKEKMLQLRRAVAESVKYDAFG